MKTLTFTRYLDAYMHCMRRGHHALCIVKIDHWTYKVPR